MVVDYSLFQTMTYVKYLISPHTIPIHHIPLIHLVEYLSVQVVMRDEKAADAVVAVLEVFAKFLSEGTAAGNNNNNSGRGRNTFSDVHVFVEHHVLLLSQYTLSRILSGYFSYASPSLALRWSNLVNCVASHQFTAVGTSAMSQTTHAPRWQYHQTNSIILIATIISFHYSFWPSP